MKDRVILLCNCFPHTTKLYSRYVYDHTMNVYYTFFACFHSNKILIALIHVCPKQLITNWYSDIHVGNHFDNTRTVTQVIELLTKLNTDNQVEKQINYKQSSHQAKRPVVFEEITPVFQCLEYIVETRETGILSALCLNLIMRIER